jgi:hypothetical protein
MVLDKPQNSWSVYIRWMVLLLLAFGGFMVQMVELGHIAHNMSSMTTYFHVGDQVNNNNNNNNNGSREDGGQEAAAAATATATKKVAPTSITSTLAPTTLFREEYFSEEDGIFKGILSTKPKSFFQTFQKEIEPLIWKSDVVDMDSA